jgi:uncharacterized membrane protein YobD (UPF0266 family)
VAITFGGVGVISKSEYFAGVALYHVAALGFGMLLCYVLLYSNIEPEDTAWLKRFLPQLMIALGLLASFVVLEHYAENFRIVRQTKTVLAFQWRNNVSTFLMLTLPFPFYAALKHPRSVIYGLVMFLSLLLTGSRGGMVFGVVEFLMCLVLLLVADKKRRTAYLYIFGLLLCAFVVFSGSLLQLFSATINRLIGVIEGETEVRIELYMRGVKDFLNHPVLGTGIGYMGNRDVHHSADFALCWYHCEPLQILASTGIVGVAAYAAQFVQRCRVLLKPSDLFHVTLFLSYISLEMMSLVNPGIFAPLPYLLIATFLLVIAEKTATLPKPTQVTEPVNTDRDKIAML